LEKTRHYFICKAFGLEIASELRLPELPESDATEHDVHIHLGNVPATLENPVKKGVRYQASPGAFLISMDRIASFLVTGGNDITVQIREGAREEDVRLFLLGSALGALLHQRKFLVIHGSAIEYKGKGLIFAGVSGVGKSTLVAGLVREGCRFISDDVCAVRFQGSSAPLLQPGYPQIKLWHDAIVRLGDEPASHRKLRQQIEKYGIATHQLIVEKPIEIHTVFILSTKNSGSHSLEEIKGIEKFTALRNNTYRFQFIDGLGLTRDHFTLAGNLAKKVRAFRLTRTLDPQHKESLPAFLSENLPDIIR
jgi:hypothetical protein